MTTNQTGDDPCFAKAMDDSWEKEFDEKFKCDQSKDGVVNWRMDYGDTPIEVCVRPLGFKNFIRDLLKQERLKAVDEKIEMINELWNYSGFIPDFINDNIKDLENQKQQLLNSIK